MTSKRDYVDNFEGNCWQKKALKDSNTNTTMDSQSYFVIYSFEALQFITKKPFISDKKFAPLQPFLKTVSIHLNNN